MVTVRTIIDIDVPESFWAHDEPESTDAQKAKDISSRVDLASYQYFKGFIDRPTRIEVAESFVVPALQPPIHRPVLLDAE